MRPRAQHVYPAERGESVQSELSETHARDPRQVLSDPRLRRPTQEAEERGRQLRHRLQVDLRIPPLRREVVGLPAGVVERA